MVMDLLEGQSLEALLEREPKLTVQRTASILAPVVAAARRPRRHRASDSKPANIFLAIENGKEIVRVLDFGIAKISSKAATASRSPATRSSPRPAPCWNALRHGARGPGEAVDARADIWALGVAPFTSVAGAGRTRARTWGSS